MLWTLLIPVCLGSVSFKKSVLLLESRTSIDNSVHQLGVVNIVHFCIRDQLPLLQWHMSSGAKRAFCLNIVEYLAI